MFVYTILHLRWLVCISRACGLTRPIAISINQRKVYVMPFGDMATNEPTFRAPPPKIWSTSPERKCSKVRKVTPLKKSMVNHGHMPYYRSTANILPRKKIKHENKYFVLWYLPNWLWPRFSDILRTKVMRFRKTGKKSCCKNTHY